MATLPPHFWPGIDSHRQYEPTNLFKWNGPPYLQPNYLSNYVQMRITEHIRKNELYFSL